MKRGAVVAPLFGISSEWGGTDVLKRGGFFFAVKNVQEGFRKKVGYNTSFAVATLRQTSSKKH